jgi:ATP-dependent exoDNAse (exonuclease V) alpha subunit
VKALSSKILIVTGGPGAGKTTIIRAILTILRAKGVLPLLELDEVVLAYATTIHKSQGSEYPAIVIPVVTQHYAMLQRNLLYTGMTRGKRLVVLVGQRKAVAIAVRGTQGRRRWSKLRELLALDDMVAASQAVK